MDLFILKVLITKAPSYSRRCAGASVSFGHNSRSFLFFLLFFFFYAMTKKILIVFCMVEFEKYLANDHYDKKKCRVQNLCI